MKEWKNEQSLGPLWDNNNSGPGAGNRSAEGEETEENKSRWKKKMLEEIIATNFPNQMENIHTQIVKKQWSMYNLKSSMEERRDGKTY